MDLVCWICNWLICFIWLNFWNWFKKFCNVVIFDFWIWMFCVFCRSLIRLLMLLMLFFVFLLRKFFVWEMFELGFFFVVICSMKLWWNFLSCWIFFNSVCFVFVKFFRICLCLVLLRSGWISEKLIRVVVDCVFVLENF